MPSDIYSPEDLPLEGASPPGSEKARKAARVIGVLEANEADARATFGDQYDTVMTALRGKVKAHVGELQMPLPDWRDGAIDEQETDISAKFRGPETSETSGEPPVAPSTMSPSMAPAPPGSARVQQAASAAGLPQGDGKPLQEGDVDSDRLLTKDELIAEGDKVKEIEKEKFFQVGDTEYGQTSSNAKELYAPPQTSAEDTALSWNWWLEPSLGQFKRDVGQDLPQGGSTIKESSKTYKEYADKQWKLAYEDAEQKGIKLKRVEYSPEVYSKGLAKGVGGVAAVASGIDRGALLGAGTLATRGLQKLEGGNLLGPQPNVLESSKENMAAHPRLSGAGQVAGMFSPMGAPNLAGRAAVEAGRLAPGAGRLLAASPALRGAVGGATGAATEAGGLEAIDAATEGRPSSAGSRAAEAALFGGLVGGGLGKLQGLAGGGRRSIETGDLGPNLKEAGKIGGETRALLGRGGMNTPPQVRALRKRAASGERGRTDEELLQAELEPGVGRAVQERVDQYGDTAEGLAQDVVKYGSETGAAYDKLVRSIETKVAKGGAKELAEAKNAITKQEAEYYRSPQGKELKSTLPLAEAWKKFFSVRLNKEGQATTQTIATENRKYTSLAESAWETGFPMSTPAEAKALATQLGEDAFAVTPASARKYGLNTDKWFEAYNNNIMKDLGLTDEAAIAAQRTSNWVQFNKPRKTIVLVPKRLNAGEVDENIAAMRRAMIDESTKGSKGQVDIPQLKIVEEGAYKVRDQFASPAGMEGVTETIRVNGRNKLLRGWSAIQHRLSNALRKAEDRLEYSGMPRSGVGDTLPAGVEQRVRNAVQGVGTGKNPVAEDAVHRFARTGGGENELNEAVRLRAESADLGMQLPAPERITEDAVKSVRGRVADYSQGRPNESLEQALHGRGLLPQLRSLPETRGQLKQLGFSPEAGADPKVAQGLLRGYRGGQMPGSTERAFENLLQGRPEGEQLQLLRGLKSLNELKFAGKLQFPMRAGFTGQGPRLFSTMSPKAAPLKLRTHATLRNFEEIGVGGPSAVAAEQTRDAFLSDRTKSGPSKMSTKDRRQLLKLRRALEPGAL